MYDRPYYVSPADIRILDVGQLLTEEIKTWCNETYGPDNWYGSNEWNSARYIFNNEEDLIIFKLRWPT